MSQQNRKREWTVQVFDSHAEADMADASERAAMTHAERMTLFAEVQRRFWGDDFPNFDDRPSLKQIGFTGTRPLHGD